MQSGTKMFTVDKFLGLNEAADGDTELKMGEASRMENWLVTDAFNLTLRPGIRRLDLDGSRDPKTILASWSGFVGSEEYFILCDYDGVQDRLWVYKQGENGGLELKTRQHGALGLTSRASPMVKIFSFGGNLFVMSRRQVVVYGEDGFQAAQVYIPLVITGAAPAGGGTALENLNLLTPLRRMDFSADGEAVCYVLPEEAVGVTAVVVDNEALDPADAGTFHPQTHTFSFSVPPEKGVGNVEFTYTTDTAAAERDWLKIAAMPLAETYNGATDTRLFLAGDGSNLCYYSGVPLSGEVTTLYFPAMNEVAVDMSGSPVTALVRHYSKLLAFKPDGAYSISYEPVTLADGNTVAGFYLRNVNREFGHDILGQVQTVSNYPRTVSRGSVYEWRITSSYYKDERYARRISDLVQRTLSQADPDKIVTCDDNTSKTYYLFLGDEEGTVLVNRYGLTEDGIWCIYRSALCRNVRNAFMNQGTMVFCNDTEAFCFDPGLTTDAAPTSGGELQQIRAQWESGFLAFGEDFRRKYSSQIYISVQPAGQTELTITAATDRRSEYMEKKISMRLFSWATAAFPTWTFSLSDAPKIQRVRLKVKKFVYYKMIFRVETFGATATVLGYDQQVRFSSLAK